MLYPDLHGLARDKDVLIGEFERWIEYGSVIGSAVMSTELRHTHMAGGEQG